MRTLTLLRHAKSGWDDPVARDFDRALNDRGMRAARRVGRYMRDAGLAFDHVVSSPAVRCVDTLDGLWEGYGRTLHPVWDRRIYLASGATLLDVVHEAPEGAHRILMCGHNPGLEDLVLALVADEAGEPLRADIEEKFPTSSVAELRFAADRWADVIANSGHLERFVRPRDLDASLGPDDS